LSSILNSGEIEIFVRGKSIFNNLLESHSSFGNKAINLRRVLIGWALGNPENLQAYGFFLPGVLPVALDNIADWHFTVIINNQNSLTFLSQNN
jgi:hypothetical protein